MPVLLGGQPCVDPRTLYRQCLDLRLPVSWFGLPNSYTCPLGVLSGEGWVLMTRGDLLRVSPALTFPDPVELMFASDALAGPRGRVALPSVLVVSADCLTPGADGDPASCYLVRLADRRRLMRRAYVDRAYNMRHTLTGAWLPDTVHSLTLPWGWEEVCADLWDLFSLGQPWPGLPVVEPDEPPEDLELWQAPFADALGTVLTRLGCDLAYDPVRDTFSVVQVGADDPDLEEAERGLRRWRVWDAYPVRGALARLAFTARVTFRKVPHVRGQGSPFYALERGESDPRRAVAGAAGVALVPDDLEALYDAHGALINSDELEARADERAEDYFRRAFSQADRQRRVYPLPLGDARLMPGRQVQSVRWADTGVGTEAARGMVTEVSRLGDVPTPGWPDVTIDPLTEVVRVTGGSSATAGGKSLYPASIQAWDAVTGEWVDRQSVWIIDANE